MFATEKTQLMLKDYLRLRDDLSSCSSGGFKSFPRRQCCTTVRFLLEMDLKTNNSGSAKQPLLKRSRYKSALQRASEAVLSAVKYLPFHSGKQLQSCSVPKSRARRGILPWSFSRKFLRRSLWKNSNRDDREIGRWRSLSELLQENNEASSDQNTAAVDATATTMITATRTSSNDSNSKSNGNNCSESAFTADILPSSSGNSESSGGTDGDEIKEESPAKEVSNRRGATAGGDSVNGTKQDWPNEEGNEQLSPVSVLDNPFDDEEENSSPFQRHLVQVEEGTKLLKLMQKTRRFESLAQLEPVDLEKRLASSELEDEWPRRRPISIDGDGKSISDESKKEKITDAGDLLKIFKYKTPSNKMKLKVESVLLDFFRERIVQGGTNGQGEFDEKETLKMAEEWVKGQSRELILEWEVKEGRKVYLKDMERNGMWRNLEEAREEVAAEMELEMLSSLVEELLI
ncbi:hypothetical protein SLEP1_g8722 [Rubroshorea leprosula]|uniref:DUF4378 domain-containing protein n=1 Tax=Rubroshorea leprosula TaxID=152421 RepID=A0AAV5I742_9ROSI|nr:hypothetical protein SLEP1_g8722 [Rubroshorea leprosula]